MVGLLGVRLGRLEARGLRWLLDLAATLLSSLIWSVLGCQDWLAAWLPGEITSDTRERIRRPDPQVVVS